MMWRESSLALAQFLDADTFTELCGGVPATRQLTQQVGAFAESPAAPGHRYVSTRRRSCTGRSLSRWSSPGVRSDG